MKRSKLLSKGRGKTRGNSDVQPGAVRVGGDGRDEEEALSEEDLEEVEMSVSDTGNINHDFSQVYIRSEHVEDQPHVVPIATTVPELVSATAKPEADDVSAACFCCGVKCGSVQQDSDVSRSRRLLYLSIAAMIITVGLVVGLAAGLAGGQSGGSDKDQPGGSDKDQPGGSGEDPGSNGDTPLETKTFFTTLDYTHCYYGHMFDITAKKDLRVTGMDIHVKSTTAMSIELWSKPGTYVDDIKEEFRWARIGQANIVGNGLHNLTVLPRDLFNPVHVEAGEKQAFYVTAQAAETVCFQERKDANGTDLIDYGEEAIFSNEDIDLNVGTGVQYRFLGNGPPNIFNGQLEYNLVE